MEKILLFHIVSYGEKTPVYFDVQRLLTNELGEFTVRPLKEYSANYHPETITYTGVTVGGVHTGGFTKNEAHYTATSKNTIYGELTYKEKEHSLPSTIHEIIFSKELQKHALEKIGKLFHDPQKNGFKLLKKSNNGFTEGMYRQAISSGNLITQSYMINKNLSNHATTETCSKVGDFLLRALHGEFLTPQQKCEAADFLLASENSLAWVAAADLLCNPTTDSERERVRLATEKIQGCKFYELGNWVFKDKKNYARALFSQIVLKGTLVAALVALMLLIAACGPGDTSGIGVALFSFVFGWIILMVIAALIEKKIDKNSCFKKQ